MKSCLSLITLVIVRSSCFFIFMNYATHDFNILILNYLRRFKLLFSTSYKEFVSMIYRSLISIIKSDISFDHFLNIKLFRSLKTLVCN